MNRKNKKVIKIIIVLIILICSITIFYNLKNKYPIYIYQYDFIINTESSLYYHMKIPVLINEINGEISPAMYQLNIEGDCSIELINTIYGKAIEIYGKGNIYLNVRKEEKIPLAWLNMVNNSYNDSNYKKYYWTYSNVTDMNIEINISLTSFVYHYLNEHQAVSYNNYIKYSGIDIGWQNYPGVQYIVNEINGGISPAMYQYKEDY